MLGEPADADLDHLLTRLGEPNDARYRVILMDEADDFVLAEAASSCSTLRRFRDLSAEGGCYFILAGFWKLYQTVSLDYHSPLRNFGELIELGALEESACQALITQPMEALNLRYEADALVQQIISGTGQRANLIALTCGAILRHLDITDRQIHAGAVSRALDDENLRNTLAGWGKLVPEDEQGCRLDRIVVYATVAQDEFSRADITRVLEGNHCPYQPEQLRESLQRLALAFVIERERDRYRYRVPLFRAMILEEEPASSLAQEIAAFRRQITR